MTMYSMVSISLNEYYILVISIAAFDLHSSIDSSFARYRNYMVISLCGSYKCHIYFIKDFFY